MKKRGFTSGFFLNIQNVVFKKKYPRDRWHYPKSNTFPNLQETTKRLPSVLKNSKSEDFDQILKKRVSIFEPEKSLAEPKSQKNRRGSVIDALEKYMPEKCKKFFDKIPYFRKRRQMRLLRKASVASATSQKADSDEEKV